MTTLLSSADEANDDNASYSRDLTPREWQVLAFVVQGLTNRQIAERLVISPRTVDHHVESILAKLGCPRRVDLARRFATYAEPAPARAGADRIP